MARFKVQPLPAGPFNVCDSVRFFNADGLQGRATYRPDWSASKPWATYWQGTATNGFATLKEASEYFAKTKQAVHGRTI